MKLTRVFTFLSDYGRLEFCPASPGWKIFWKGTGQPELRRVGWVAEKPNRALATFFIRKSVAEDRGEDPYTYTDSRRDPPL